MDKKIVLGIALALFVVVIGSVILLKDIGVLEEKSPDTIEFGEGVGEKGAIAEEALEKTNEGDIKKVYSRYGLDVYFNGKENKGIVANVSDEKFQAFFLEDIKPLISPYEGIKDIEIKYIYPEENKWVINMLHDPDIETGENLNKVREQLKDRWYTERVEKEEEYSTAEDIA